MGKDHPPDKSVLNAFDKSILQQGEREYRRKNVLSIRWQDATTLVGRVAGQKAEGYRCMAALTHDRKKVLSATCSCAKNVLCKHIAALMVAYVEKPSDIEVMGRDLPQSGRVSDLSPRGNSFLKDILTHCREGATLTETTLGWRVASDSETKLNLSKPLPAQKEPDDSLFELDEALSEHLSRIADAIISRRMGTLTQSSLNLAYLLSVKSPGELPQLIVYNKTVEMVKGKPRDVLRKMRAEFQWKNASGEQSEVREWWRAANMVSKSDQTSEVQQQIWFNLLRSCVQTGKCFFEKLASHPVKLGPCLPGFVVSTDCGDQKNQPTVSVTRREGEFASARELVCIPWSTPWYLDAQNHEIGPATLNLSPKALREIFQMSEVDETNWACDVTDSAGKKESGGESAPNIQFLLTASAVGDLPQLSAYKKICEDKQEQRQDTYKKIRCDSPWDDASIEQKNIREWWKVAMNSIENNQSNSAQQLMWNHLIDCCLKTGQCFFEDLSSPPLTLGPTLQGRAEWIKTKNGAHKLSITVRREERVIECIPWSIPWYFDADTHEIGAANIDLPPGAMRAIHQMPAISEQHRVACLSKLHELGIAGDIPLPPGTKDYIFNFIPAPKPLLLVQDFKPTKSTQPSDPELCQPWAFRGLKLVYPPKSLTHKTINRSDGLTEIQRMDKKGIPGLIKHITDLGFENINARVSGVPDTEFYFLPIADTNTRCWGQFNREKVDELKRLGFEITPENERLLTVRSVAESGQFVVDVHSEESGWFSGELILKVEDQQIAMFPLLKKVFEAFPTLSPETIDEKFNHEGNLVMPTTTGIVVAIPYKRIRELLHTLHELLTQSTTFRICALHALQLKEHDPTITFQGPSADRLHAYLESIRSLCEVSSTSPPANLRATLRSYQLEGYSWLERLSSHQFGGILADDMGLGKTLQVLACILKNKEDAPENGPVLVVCPSSLVSNWISETEKFAPTLTILPFVGKGRTFEPSEFKAADIVLTTYSLLTREKDSLQKIHWRGVILDEAQRIKNPAAQVTEVAKSLKSKYRICMTGTPLENSLEELWSLFDFIMPGWLGERTRFKKLFRGPIEEEGNADRLKLLQKRIRPFMLRRTKKEVLPDLPDKIEIIKLVELSEPQQNFYETLRALIDRRIKEVIEKHGFKKSHIEILNVITKLRQACLHPRLVKIENARPLDEGETGPTVGVQSAKLDELMEMVGQLVSEHRQILIFSQFTSMLDIIAERLREDEIEFVELRGDTRDRAKPVERFQKDKVPVFLLSLKSGGVGLNLTAAEVVIHFDPWWNPFAQDQASDRAHRIGQTKNVFDYKLIARGTIEEKIMQLQERKRQLGLSLFDARGGLSSHFTEDDLRDLLAPIDDL